MTDNLKPREIAERISSAEDGMYAENYVTLARGYLAATTLPPKGALEALKKFGGHIYPCNWEERREEHCAHCNKVKDRHYWESELAENGCCKDERGRPLRTKWTPRPALDCDCGLHAAIASLSNATSEKSSAVPLPPEMEERIPHAADCGANICADCIECAYGDAGCELGHSECARYKVAGSLPCNCFRTEVISTIRTLQAQLTGKGDEC